MGLFVSQMSPVHITHFKTILILSFLLRQVFSFRVSILKCCMYFSFLLCLPYAPPNKTVKYNILLRSVLIETNGPFEVCTSKFETKVDHRYAYDFINILD